MNGWKGVSSAIAITAVLMTGCGGSSGGSSRNEPVAEDPPAPPAVRTFERDTDNDGTVDNREETFYDPALGKPTSSRYDDNMDGIWDATTAYTYDASGNATLTAWDDDGDGIDDYVERRTFDASGNFLTLEQDAGADGSADFILTRTYDAAGRVLTDAVDPDADGIANSITTNAYNGDGDLSRRETDSNGDGIANRIEVWTYSAPTAKATYTRDANADGTVDERWFYTYTDDVRLLTLRRDLGDDGTIDYSRVDTLTDSADGSWQADVTIDSDNDGLIDQRWQRLYTADGLILNDLRDNDVDDVFDSGFRRQRNDAGKVIRSESVGPGTVFDIRVTTYNDDQNPTRLDRDLDGDGAVDYVETTSYADWTIGELDAD